MVMWHDDAGHRHHLSDEPPGVLTTAGQAQIVTPQVPMDDVLAVEVCHGRRDVLGCGVHCHSVACRGGVDDTVFRHEPASLKSFLQRYGQALSTCWAPLALQG